MNFFLKQPETYYPNILRRFNLEYPNNDKHQLPQRDDKNSDTAPYYGFYEAVMFIYFNVNDVFIIQITKKNITITFIIMALNISAKKR